MVTFSPGPGDYHSEENLMGKYNNQLRFSNTERKTFASKEKDNEPGPGFYE